jgi:hypothetical protein
VGTQRKKAADPFAALLREKRRAEANEIAGMPLRMVDAEAEEALAFGTFLGLGDEGESSRSPRTPSCDGVAHRAEYGFDAEDGEQAQVEVQEADTERLLGEAEGRAVRRIITGDRLGAMEQRKEGVGVALWTHASVLDSVCEDLNLLPVPHLQHGERDLGGGAILDLLRARVADGGKVVLEMF